MASSSNPSPLNFTYDVFVSYMHADTGNSFTSHLKSAFDKEGFIVAMNDTVDKGEEISDTVLSNICESLVCVVVFSKSYASCGQCLDELVKIWERKEEKGGSVLPVFLGVEPTHVRKQTGAFGDGFQRLIESSKRFKEKEETWKSALTKTANLSGWEDSTVKFEAEIVDAIVECIKKTLDQLPSRNYSNGFVGIYQVEKVISLLQLQSKTNVQFLGIWGMGGIGKTKISMELCDQISSLFDATCYLEKVRELESMGLQFLSKELFSQLKIDFKPLLLRSAQRALSRKRVLIILDDVSNSTKLMSFVNDLPYGSGSRIILTCRDKQVLRNYRCKVYEVKILDDYESLKLFKFHAFKGQLCHELYEALLNKAVSYCGGLPLALELLGCHLYDKNFGEWESELRKLEIIPYRDVDDAIKISYEGLDKYNKSIFLDIACMFCGWDEFTVKRILHAHCPDSGIRCLTDKALITNSNGILRMHDLIRQFGQHMVSSESEEPSNRSRLWKFEDFSRMVARNTGSEKVEVISVDLNEDFERTRNTYMKPDFFEKMDRLRVLDLYGIPLRGFKNLPEINLPEGLSSLSNKLSYLRWNFYPLTSFPKMFSNHLVELRLSKSRLKQLWSEGAEPHLPLLEYMELHGSKDLIKLPNLSKCPKLEILHLGLCDALVEVPSSIQHLSKLETLIMDGCENLAKLPVLPQSIVSLDLNGTNFEELPSWIGSLSQLERLALFTCSNLTSLPESLGSLQSLTELLMSHSGIRNLPLSIGHLVSLERMCLSYTDIESLPASIVDLSQLKELDIEECKNLKSLPGLPSSLEELNANGCTSLTTVGNIFRKYDGRCLVIDMRGCFNLEGQNSMIMRLARLHAHAKYSAVLPGSEVPECFEHKAEGSSIEVELRGGMLHKVAFCIVIDDILNIRGKPYDELLLEGRCQCMFVTELGERCFYSSSGSCHLLYAGGTHMLLWAGPVGAPLSSNPIIQAKFEFEVRFPNLVYRTDYNSMKSECKIMHCGVSFSTDWETGWKKVAKANTRKRKAERNLTKKRNRVPKNRKFDGPTFTL